MGKRFWRRIGRSAWYCALFHGTYHVGVGNRLYYCRLCLWDDG